MWSAFLVFKARMGVSSGVYSQLCHSSSVTISHFTKVPVSSVLQWGIGLMINWTTLHNSICMTLKMLQKHFISGSAKGREYFKAIFMENRGVGIKWIFTMLRAAVILYDWTSLSNMTCNEFVRLQCPFTHNSVIQSLINFVQFRVSITLSSTT